MGKPTGPSNEHLKNLIIELRMQDAKIWRRTAEELAKPTRKRRAVNLSRLQLHAKDGEIVLVPGKVLGTGKLEKKLTIAAWQFSKQAEEAIKKAKGSAITIQELMKKSPKGTGVKIYG